MNIVFIILWTLLVNILLHLFLQRKQTCKSSSIVYHMHQYIHRNTAIHYLEYFIDVLLLLMGGVVRYAVVLVRGVAGR